MTKIFQICVDGVETESFYAAHTAEEAIEDYKKDCVEEYERDFGGEPDMTVFDYVEAILYDEYEGWWAALILLKKNSEKSSFFLL